LRDSNKGTDGFLTMPYSAGDLRALIGEMLESARIRAEAEVVKAWEQIQRQAASERAALLESITDAFYALDGQWRFTYVNQRALDHFRRDPEELLGRRFSDVALRQVLQSVSTRNPARKRQPASLDALLSAITKALQPSL
jgi:PAS domain-containing protein